MADKEFSITKLLQDSDRAEVLEWLKDNLGEATHCVILCGFPDKETDGLTIRGRQYGFRYSYEIDGFINWFLQDADWNGEESEDTE